MENGELSIVHESPKTREFYEHVCCYLTVK